VHGAVACLVHREAVGCKLVNEGRKALPGAKQQATASTATALLLLRCCIVLEVIV
jgi:hypothetical protein